MWVNQDEYEDAEYVSFGFDFQQISLPEAMDDERVDFYVTRLLSGGAVRGLKDHQIQELVNAIRDATAPMIPHQCLREVISSAALRYLEAKGLRIDK